MSAAAATVVLGADLIAYFTAWPPGLDYYHESGFTEETEGVLCHLDDDGITMGRAVRSEEWVAVDGELFWQGKGDEPPGREHDLGRAVAAWIAARTHGTLVVELPWGRMDEAQATLRALGGRVVVASKGGGA